MRGLFLWVEAHREQLVQHATDLAELREILPDSRARDRIERIAFENGAALEALDRAYPRDIASEDDTAPIEVTR